MKLDKNDIAEQEEIGHTHAGDKIFHIASKGGLSLICKQRPSGQMTILAQASHPALARHLAQELDKSITYNESLFKSSGQHPDERVPLVKFTPDMAYKMAHWHSRMAGGIQLDHPDAGVAALNKLKYLAHTDNAIKNYKASGMHHEAAQEEHKKNQKMHRGITQDDMPPIDQAKLEDAYYRKTGKQYPKGLEEILKTDKEQ